MGPYKELVEDLLLNVAAKVQIVHPKKMLCIDRPFFWI